MKTSWLLSGSAVIAALVMGCSAHDEKTRTLSGELAEGPPVPACASPLGAEVAKAVWPASERAGTVPRAFLYTSKNAAEGPYVDAKEIFGAMAGLVESARYEVDLESFEWGALFFELDRDTLARDAGTVIADPGGPTPASVVDPTALLMGSLVRLEQRLRREADEGRAATLPVKVNIAIDGMSRSSPLVGKLGNPAVYKSRALHKQLSQIALDPSLVEVHVGAYERMAGGALHSKVLVVDGYRAIVTGANPQDFQMLGASWHDSGYAVSGDAGRALQAAFDDTWSVSSEVKSCQLEGFDPGATSGFTCAMGSTTVSHHDAVSSPAIDEDAAVAGSCLPVIAATRREVGWDTVDPRDVTTPQDRAFLGMLAAAGGVVRMETPNLNAPMAKDAIVGALERGVEVRVVLSLGFNGESERQTISVPGKTLWSAGGSNEDTMRELYTRLAGTEACKRLDVRFYSRDGARPAFRQEKGWASHTKYLSIDGTLAMVGSANQDVASWAMARESNLVVDSAEATARWDARLFDRDFAAAIPIATYAQRVLDGSATKEGGETASADDLAVLFAGDAEGWARTVLDACPR